MKNPEKKIIYVLLFILFQAQTIAQTRIVNVLGDSDDFSPSADIYLVRFNWEGPNIPGGSYHGEFLHQETQSDYRVFTDAPDDQGFIKARTIRMSTNAEFYTKAIGTDNPVYLGIRYKDNLPAFYGPESVYAYNGSGFVQIGDLSGSFDHKWKVGVIEVSPSDLKAIEGKYRFRIGIGTYGNGLKSDLAIERIELATTRAQLTVEPGITGYYPAGNDVYPNMSKQTPWYVDGSPFFPVGFAAGWTGMSEKKFQEVADSGFNVLLFYNWMNKERPYSEAGIWGVMSSGDHYGFTEFLDACHARGLKAIGVFQHDVRYPVIPGYFKSEKECLDFITGVCAAHKDHPALLGWSPVDEPDHSRIPDFFSSLEWCMGIKEAIRKGDSGHPVYALEIGWREGAFGHYQDIADYQGYDVYPSYGSSVREIGERADLLTEETFSKKPFIAFLKAYDRKADQAYMSFAEAYIALIHGANGIFYWSLSGSPPIFSTLSRIAREIKAINHVLLPPAKSLDVNGTNGYCTDNSPDVENIYKQGGDGLGYVIAVNTEDSTAGNVTFTVSGLKAGTQIPVLFENRTIISGPETFSDNFSAYSRHVYQLGQPRTGPHQDMKGGIPADNFKPLFVDASTEEKTGMNFIPSFTKNNQPAFPENELFDHLYTVRMEATSESVTGGTALRVNYDAGTKFTVTYPECKKNTFPPGTAGLTFYAKGSQAIAIRVKTINGESGDLNVTTGWQKFNIPATPLLDNLTDGHELNIFSTETLSNAGYLLIDRFGAEQVFDPEPSVDIQLNSDNHISSGEILSGSATLDDFRTRLRNHRPLKIFGWGNSIADGVQMNRGGHVHPWSGWDYRGKLEERFYGRLAAKLEKQYGYKGITPVDKATGGNRIVSPSAVVQKNEILSGSFPGDLVIIEFGANDLNGGSLTSFAGHVAAAVDEFKEKGLNVIIMTPSICEYDKPGANVSTETLLTEAMEKIVSEKKVAMVNILKLMTYRGDAYAWAWENNNCHPGYWGHELIAQCLFALIENLSFIWSPENDYPERTWKQ